MSVSPDRSRDEPTVAVFAPAPVLVATLEHPDDGSAAEVAINVGGQGPIGTWTPPCCAG